MIHHGGCQCGAVEYSADAAFDQPVSCNCSRRQKLGIIPLFAPRAAFNLDQGADVPIEYKLNTGKIRHLFCKTSGIESYALAVMPDGAPAVAIKVNCLDAVDARKIAKAAYHHDRCSA